MDDGGIGEALARKKDYPIDCNDGLGKSKGTPRERKLREAVRPTKVYG